MKLCMVLENFEEKYEENKIKKKKRKKNKFKINKLFLYIFLNSFNLISSII